LPQTLVVAALSLGGSARLIKRFGATRVIVGGLSVAAVGVAIMASLAIHEPYFPLRATAHVLLGIGFGTSFLPLLTVAMSEVPPADAGLGSAIVNLSLQLAAAVDIAVLVTASSHRTRTLVEAGRSVTDATVLGYRLAYGIAVVALLAGITLSAALLRRRSARAMLRDGAQ
jgi:hypothetical protein